MIEAGDNVVMVVVLVSDARRITYHGWQWLCQ
jgi:hypothetical protein